MRLLIKCFYGKTRLLQYYNSKTGSSLSFWSYILEFDKIKCIRHNHSLIYTYGKLHKFRLWIKVFLFCLELPALFTHLHCRRLQIYRWIWTGRIWESRIWFRNFTNAGQGSDKSVWYRIQPQQYQQDATVVSCLSKMCDAVARIKLEPLCGALEDRWSRGKIILFARVWAGKLGRERAETANEKHAVSTIDTE